MAENCRTFLADRSRPFFLYFCTSDPHRGGGTLNDKPGTPDAFGNNRTYDGVAEVAYDPQKVIVPPWLPDNAASRAELAEYYQSVSRVDQGVGRLVQVLKETQQYDNTLFIYTADNGCAMPGSKTTLYEPGMRLPLIVRAPQAARPGLKSDAMISWVDFTPTILHVAGVERVTAPPLVAGESETGVPKKKGSNSGIYTFHGRSFLPILNQEKPAGWNEVFASHTFHEIQMYYPMRVLRTERYKLILNVAHPLPFPFASDLYASSTWQSVLKGGSDARFGQRRVADLVQRPKYELYDLQADPYEAKNLADDPAQQKTLQDLAERLKTYQKKTRDPWVQKYEYE
jgi:N-sulfoglucosamine sulfohydrolase